MACRQLASGGGTEGVGGPLSMVALDSDEPGEADERHGDGDEEVQPQAEKVGRGVDPDRLFEDAVPAVPGDVEGEQALRPDLPVVAEPDEYRGPGRSKIRE
jgi:hypothetical protein